MSESRQRTCIQIGRGQARVWKSDRGQAKLDRYAANPAAHSDGPANVEPSSSQAPVLPTERSLPSSESLRCDPSAIQSSVGTVATSESSASGISYVATGSRPARIRYRSDPGLGQVSGSLVAIEPDSERQYDTSPCILKPRKTRSKRVESEDGPKGPKTRLEAHPTIFLNQKPVNHSMVRAWPTRKDKCQVSADKYGSFEDNWQKSKSFPYLNGNRQCEFRFPQFGARRRGGYGLLLLIATKRLIETMFGYMKDKLAALTAPMANAYANAVVFNKIENLVATFRHRKSTITSSRFLPVNKKGNDKSYQNLVNKSRCIRVLPKHVFRKHFGRIKLVLPKKPLKNPYVNRGKRKHNKTITQLGRYVATEHAHCSVATDRARTRCSVASDRAHTLLGRYVVTELKPTLHSLHSDLVSVEILRRKQVGLVSACFHSLRSDLSDCQSLRSDLGPPLRSPLNSHRNAFGFVSIGVSVEILRQKQINLILNSLACFSSPYLHLCVPFRISIETSLVSPRLKLPLRLYDIKKKKPQRPIFSHGFRLISVKISITVFTKSNLRKDIFTNSLAVKYRPNLNRTTKYRLSEGNRHVSKSAADKLEYGNQTADKPSSIDTRQPSMHTARSLRSDRARAKARSLRSDRAIVPLGRYVATELEPKLGRYVATERSSRSRLNLSERQYDTSSCILVKTFECYLPKTVASSVHKPRKTRSKRVESEDGPKGPKTRLEAHPTIFLIKSPINVKFPRINTEVLKIIVKIGKNGISPFLCYDGLRAEDANFGSHTWSPRIDRAWLVHGLISILELVRGRFVYMSVAFGQSVFSGSIEIWMIFYCKALRKDIFTKITFCKNVYADFYGLSDIDSVVTDFDPNNS
ncbi:hypothetical protein IGI04_023479 [Brassica rapa subsp. trilocularis]|uniref:Uncharacterized protein n=1 Tax=Brassica rapa subsp. trilocularis TaxID=1813537 RepID=A0ABQ7M859_BRACM|nr:hypothetical protein IGI04_023479 [Brassica rapa subsp. trilocularis]